MRRIWYAAYGSNLSLERFRCYLAGGRPPGGAREYAGCRDPRDPAEVIPLTLPGALYFAGRSTVWGGGSAFYDPESDGEVAGRGYLLTPGQLSDVVAQEIRLPTGTDLELTDDELAVDGLHYRRVVPLGRRAGVPVVTLTSARGGHQEWTAPSAAYLRTIGAGLRQAHGWSADWIGRYLSAARGAAGEWTAARISALVPDQP